MRTILLGVLYLVGVAGFVLGVLIFTKAESAVHEIEALICCVIGVLGFGLGLIVQTLEAVRDEVEVSTKMNVRREAK